MRSNRNSIFIKVVFLVIQFKNEIVVSGVLNIIFSRSGRIEIVARAFRIEVKNSLFLYVILNLFL